MTPRTRRGKLRWQREHPEKRRVYNRRYYGKNAEALRAHRRRVYAADPKKALEPTRRFFAEHPNYQREYRARRRLEAALLKFATVCASGRALLEALP